MGTGLSCCEWWIFWNLDFARQYELECEVRLRKPVYSVLLIGASLVNVNYRMGAPLQCRRWDTIPRKEWARDSWTNVCSCKFLLDTLHSSIEQASRMCWQNFCTRDVHGRLRKAAPLCVLLRFSFCRSRSAKRSWYGHPVVECLNGQYVIFLEREPFGKRDLFHALFFHRYSAKRNSSLTLLF